MHDSWILGCGFVQLDHVQLSVCVHAELSSYFKDMILQDGLIVELESWLCSLTLLADIGLTQIYGYMLSDIRKYKLCFLFFAENACDDLQ